MSGPSELFDACSELLAASVAALGALCPERRYVSMALPSLDCCDQLNVHPQEVGETQWASPTGGGAVLPPRANQFGPSVLQATLIVTVAWGVTVPKTPEEVIDPLVLQEEAQQAIYGGWGLWNGLRSGFAQEAIFAGRGVEMASLTPLQYQGEMVGWTVPVRVDVPGYDIAWQT